MYHLFLVHSHATHRCALAIIETLGLKEKDCIFGTHRNFVPCPTIDPIRFRALNFLTEPNGSAIRPVLRLKNKLKRIDEELSNLMGGDSYHCYLPHTYFDSFHLPITHPKCSGFSFIEEGLTSYYKPSEIDIAYPPRRFSYRTKCLRSLLFKKRLLNEFSFFRDDYTMSYGFTDYSFPKWPRRRTLGIDYLFPPASDTKISPPILAFDCLVELGLSSESALIAALAKFCESLIEQGFERFLYKLHPGQANGHSPQAIKQIFSKYRDNLTDIQLDSSYSLEDHFNSSNGLVYVFNSAAGLYAALNGKNVSTLNPLIEAQDPSYSKTIAKLPHVFHELVKPIFSSRTFSNV